MKVRGKRIVLISRAEYLLGLVWMRPKDVAALAARVDGEG